MSLKSASATTIATFPPGFFLENIEILPDGTLLVTVANRKALYAVPPAADGSQVRYPILLHQFADDAWAMGIARPSPSSPLAYILTTDFVSQGSSKHYLSLLDFRNVAAACHPQELMEFPGDAKSLNGLVALSETVLLAADSFGGCIWRIDVTLDDNGTPRSAQAKVWLKDHAFDGHLVLPDFQPGVNGLKYSRKTELLCFSSTQQKIFGIVPVDPTTLNPSSSVQILLTGPQGDDMLIDDGHSDGPVAYLTTHRDNSIIRIPIARSEVGQVNTAPEPQVVLFADQNTPLLLGPTSGVWQPGFEGKVAYFNCDGGLKNPLPGELPRYARILRVAF